MLRSCALGVIRTNSSALFSTRLAALFRGDVRRWRDARCFASGMDSLTSLLVVGSAQTTALNSQKILDGDADVRALNNKITWIQGEISKLCRKTEENEEKMKSIDDELCLFKSPSRSGDSTALLERTRLEENLKLHQKYHIILCDRTN